jgi:hypothetical protein
MTEATSRDATPEDHLTTRLPGWQLWTPAAAEENEGLHEAVERFQPLDHAAGHAAARWLKDESLDNDPSTRTHLLLADERVEGFFACSMTTVAISRRVLRAEAMPARRETVPAVLLAWIARHADSRIDGRDIVAVAYGLARHASANVGAVAFVLDPHDDPTADMWMSARYGFRRSKGEGKRLWLPLHVSSEGALRP